MTLSDTEFAMPANGIKETELVYECYCWKNHSWQRMYFHCMLKLECLMKTFFRLCVLFYFLSSITGFGVCSCWIYSFQNTTDFSVSLVCMVYCWSSTPVGFFSLFLILILNDTTSTSPSSPDFSLCSTVCLHYQIPVTQRKGTDPLFNSAMWQTLFSSKWMWSKAVTCMPSACYSTGKALLHCIALLIHG